jgi:signal transduction histidine kinase
MTLVLQIITIGFLLVEASLLGYAWVNRAQLRSFQWLSAVGIGILLLTVLQLIPSDTQYISRLNHSVVIWIAIIAVLTIFSNLVLRDVIRDDPITSQRRVSLSIAGIWAIVFLIAALFATVPFVGWYQWNSGVPVIAMLVWVVGLISFVGYLIKLVFSQFYTAPMPEVANRASFWLVQTLLVIFSLFLITSVQPLVMIFGTLFLIVMYSLSIYGVQRHRLIDMRDAVFVSAQTLAVVFTSWTLIFATLYFLNISTIDILDVLNFASAEAETLFIAGTALSIAILIVPARYIIELLFRQVMQRIRPNLAQATAQYSQRVARAASLEEVVNATTETLNRVMNVNTSALVLINNTFRVKNAIELIVLEHGATLQNPSATGYVDKESAVFRTIAVEKVPIGLFDIQFGNAYQDIPATEKKFFNALKMSVFVPVVAEGRLIGLLACGTKLNDSPYNRDDIELLSVIGQQVGTALRSARLIDDLQHLNDNMRVLNKRLETAKVELEKLDGVKTDFITIASHELRTPLAQIRGYTDIIDSLNEAEALQKEQTSHMVKNLRRSTERMEELISAMLDVSQIDVNSMDLRFIQTKPETIIKLALEPLRDPAEERNISVEREPMSDLPEIEADLQRMVQAIRNLVLNAIKFTPDGGQIRISAVLEAAANPQDRHVVFAIADTGVGIAAKDLKYIFQKFYRGFDTQLHSTGIYKFMGAGPGLGLTIAKGIIEGHGGEVWAESEGHSMAEPPGSTFYVRLPLSPPKGVRRVQPFEQDDDKTRSTNTMKAVE